MKNFIPLLLIMLFISGFCFNTVNAQISGGSGSGGTPGFATYEPLVSLPLDESGNTPTELSKYLPAMFQFLIGIAGVLAVVMIVIGGIQYMSTDAVYGKSAGKEKITQAIGGLILAIVSWLILYTINPELLNTTLGGPNTKPAGETPTAQYSYYAKILTYPQQQGSPAQQTICEGPFSSYEICENTREQLINSVYSPPNYNTYSSGCTTACEPSSVASQPWAVKVWDNGPETFKDCYPGYANYNACESARPTIRANYSPAEPQPPYSTCVLESQC